MTKLPTNEEYEAVVVAVGNSKGVRVPAGFFKAHPEFKGKVRMTVVAEGAVLLSAKAEAPQTKRREEEMDPVMGAFLRFLEEHMTANPQDIVPVDAAQMKRIARLVKGVSTD